LHRVCSPLALGEALLGLQQPMHHQQLAHQVIEGLAGSLPVRIADRPGEERMGLLSLLSSHAPWVCHPRPLDRLTRRCCRVVVWVVADDLDDLDEAKGGSQPAEGRELVIVDLGHTTMLPPSWLEHRAAPGRCHPDSIYI
jgi:hypothetical protein